MSVLLALTLVPAGVPQNVSAKEIRLKNIAGKTKTMAVEKRNRSGSSQSENRWAIPSARKQAVTPAPSGNSEYGGDDSIASYVEPVSAEYDKTDTDTAVYHAVEITLAAKAPFEKIKEDTYEISKKNKLTITAPETYLLHAETAEEAVDGLIEVDYAEDANGETPTGTVHIILDGINYQWVRNLKYLFQKRKRYQSCR